MIRAICQAKRMNYYSFSTKISLFASSVFYICVVLRWLIWFGFCAKRQSFRQSKVSCNWDKLVYLSILWHWICIKLQVIMWLKEIIPEKDKTQGKLSIRNHIMRIKKILDLKFCQITIYNNYLIYIQLKLW